MVVASKGGSGYATTSVITIAGTSLGGSSPNDDITVTPLVLGSERSPTRYLYIKKVNQRLSCLDLVLPYFSI